VPLARRQRQAQPRKARLAHAGPHPLIPLIGQAHPLRPVLHIAVFLAPPIVPLPRAVSRPPFGRRMLRRA
jgi:hypothetical protein